MQKPIAKSVTRLAPLALALAGLVGLASGCEEKGPVQKAGESVDKGIDKAKDAVTGAGPGEKAGRAVDRATKP